MSLTGPFYFIVVSLLPGLLIAFNFNRNSNIRHYFSKSQLQSQAQDTKTTLETSRFLNYSIASRIKSEYGTPLYVYSEKILRQQAQNTLNFPNSYGLTVRFAMKACPNAAVLQLFKNMGINFDASSGFEVLRAILAGVDPKAISLSAQELPANFESLYKQGIEFNACSLHQLEIFGKLFPGGKCGVRINPGKGSGGTGKTVSSV